MSVLGRVLDGVVFHTGQVVVCWRTDLDATQGKGRGRSSLGIYASWEALNVLCRATRLSLGTATVGHAEGQRVHRAGPVGHMSEQLGVVRERRPQARPDIMTSAERG